MLSSCHLHRNVPFWRNTHRLVPMTTTATTRRFMASIGMKRFPAGRMNEAPSVGLSASLNAAGFRLGRLQTGTPARLAKDSINFSKLVIQEGDKSPLPFSFMNDRVANAVMLTAYVSS